MKFITWMDYHHTNHSRRTGNITEAETEFDAVLSAVREELDYTSLSENPDSIEEIIAELSKHRETFDNATQEEQSHIIAETSDGYVVRLIIGADTRKFIASSVSPEFDKWEAWWAHARQYEEHQADVDTLMAMDKRELVSTFLERIAKTQPNNTGRLIT